MSRPLLWSVGSNCQRSTCVPNLKSIALTVFEILRALRNFEIGSRHPGHAHLRGQFAICEQKLPVVCQCATLKSLALSATKIWHIFLLRINWSRDLDLWRFDLESGVWVTCDVGYLYANFCLLRPLCSRLRPDVRDRQTSDVRQTSDAHHRLMPTPRGRGHTKLLAWRRGLRRIWELPNIGPTFRSD